MDEIKLVPYDPTWPMQYAAEIARVLAALPGDLIIAVEHFGSTAISGLPAKPIIDILIAARSVGEARAVAVGRLDSLGYAFWPDNPKTDRLAAAVGCRDTRRRLTSNRGQLLPAPHCHKSPPPRSPPRCRWHRRAACLPDRCCE